MTMEMTMTYSCNKAPPEITSGAFSGLLDFNCFADGAHRSEMKRVM